MKVLEFARELADGFLGSRTRRRTSAVARSLQFGIEQVEQRVLLTAQYALEHSGSGFFGRTVAASDQYYAVGNYATDYSDQTTYDGYVNVYSAGTNTLVRRIDGVAGAEEAFGARIALSGNLLAVAVGENQGAAVGTNPHRYVSVYNVETGEKQWTFSYPTGIGFGSGRPLTIAISGNLLAVSDHPDVDLLEPRIISQAHVDIYDLTSGELLRTFVDPTPIDFTNITMGFGVSISLSGTTMAVSDTFGGLRSSPDSTHTPYADDTTYVYDIVTGEIIRELKSTYTYAYTEWNYNSYFGTHVSVSGNLIAVESTEAILHEGDWNMLEKPLWDIVEVFDLETGLRIATIHGDTFHDPFGSRPGFGAGPFISATDPICLYQDRLAVTGAQLINGQNEGRVYIYDARNGRLLQTVNSSDLPNQSGDPYIGAGYAHDWHWGGSVALTGGFLLSGGSINRGAVAGGDNSKVYVLPFRGNDLLMFDAGTGRWRLGRNVDGDFTWFNGPKWNPASGWRTFIGDFNGDKLIDGIGINNQNAVFWARNNGNGTMTTISAGGLSSLETFQNFLVGDFDGDGRDDLLFQQGTHNTTPLPGSWYTKSWNGVRFTNSFYGRWEAAGWLGFGVDDVNLDGADDIVGLINAQGLDRVNWIYGISNMIPDGSRRFVSQFAGAFSGRLETAGWSSPVFGDWNGDLRLDVAARRGDGRFVYGISTGGPTDNTVLSAKRLVNATGPLFSTTAFTGQFLVGDFNNDGKDDILGVQDNNKNLWLSLTTAAGLPPASAQLWGAWNGASTRIGSAIGDFDGDYYDDYMSVDLGVGQAYATFGAHTFNSFQVQQQIISGEATVGPLTIGTGR